ncbi:class I SAM-dependent methyltransferase [Phaeovulum sp.]|uniref:class I SAM-dependent methyltransferase n=1 Tax=Phaeovulum sp. TaxID=2934796 RepID=UPI002730D525|nr:methyltransferase [Phaeovulum sp.]MDP1667977.1 methyltransferase [Phaeovulum sp.]MDZ4119427.1 methyltransferase [Phaeovulum sp.]
MADPRLSLALAVPDALPPAGRILLLRPRAEHDLSALPQARLHLVQGFRPDFEALSAQGDTVSPEPEGRYAAAFVFVPRARSEAEALLAEAAARVVPGGPIWVDGAKTDGIDGILRAVRARLAVDEPISKAHGKIFRFAAPRPEALADWRGQRFNPAPGFTTVPGVFSAEALDRGSALLGAALPARLPARVADLGAGWGWLSAQVLAREGVEECHLIEAEHAALACARANITDPRARFHWADARNFRPEARFGAVVMNPPFHSSRNADPALGLAFIAAAQAMLSLSGTLYMVANRHLPYVKHLKSLFRVVDELGDDPGYRLIRAQRPQAAPKPRVTPPSRAGR